MSECNEVLSCNELIRYLHLWVVVPNEVASECKSTLSELFADVEYKAL